MKLNKTLVLPTVALLLVVGAGAVLATSSPRADSGGTGVVPAAESASPSSAPSDKVKKAFQDQVLTDVLDQLVTKGTITAAQKQAILDGMQAERDALIAKAKAAQEARRQAAQQLKDFLSDGVITKDEFDKLPADSPLRQMTNLMDDGKITTDELKTLGRSFLGGFGGPHDSTADSFSGPRERGSPIVPCARLSAGVAGAGRVADAGQVNRAVRGGSRLPCAHDSGARHRSRRGRRSRTPRS